MEEGVEGTDLMPLLDLMLEKIPAPEYDEGAPLQAHVTYLGASPIWGAWRSAGCARGRSATGQQIAWCRADGTVAARRSRSPFITQGLERVTAEEAGPGEIIAVAGLEEVTIGETLADPENPQPLPVITVDEPVAVAGAGDQHLADGGAGRRHRSCTARQIRARLDQELVGNVSVRVKDTERPDAWEVQGRGELQLVVLLEMMRRGLRDDRRAAARRHAGDRRQGARAGRAPGDRRPRGARRRGDADAGGAQRAARADGQPLADRPGADGTTWCRPAG